MFLSFLCLDLSIKTYLENVLYLSPLLSDLSMYGRACHWRDASWFYVIFQYTILLVVVFISESVIGLLSYVYQDRLGPDLEDTLTQSFISSYGLDHDRTLAADNIQLKVRNNYQTSPSSLAYTHKG